MAAHQGFKLTDELAVAAARQIGLDATLQRGQARLLQTRDLPTGKLEVGHLGVRRSAPEGEGIPEAQRRPSGIAPGQGGVGLLRRSLEPVGVERVRLDRDRVPGRSRLDEFLAQGPSQM